jgi:hypothetical protein
MNHTLTIEIPDDVYGPLLEQAKQSGRTPEELAAECLATTLAAKASSSTDDPLLQLMGTIVSDVTDVAERHDYYLGEQVMKDLRREGDD